MRRAAAGLLTEAGFLGGHEVLDEQGDDRVQGDKAEDAAAEKVGVAALLGSTVTPTDAYDLEEVRQRPYRKQCERQSKGSQQYKARINNNKTMVRMLLS